MENNNRNHSPSYTTFAGLLSALTGAGQRLYLYEAYDRIRTELNALPGEGVPVIVFDDERFPGGLLTRANPRKNAPADIPGADLSALQRCAECGCTDADCSACIAAQGYPCHWVTPSLCSRCALEKYQPDLGRAAYDAYCELSGWKSMVTGDSLPQFDDQADHIQEGWAKAGAAAAAAFARKVSGF